MKKLKRVLIYLVCIVLVGVVGYRMIGHLVVVHNNHKLAAAIQSAKGQVSLNEVIPFDWDTIYTMEPYASRESVEQKIGFKSNEIKENHINEGMVHFIVVKDQKVVASVLGYAERLKYMLDITPKETQEITFAENATFNVTQIEGITVLTYMK